MVKITNYRKPLPSLHLSSSELSKSSRSSRHSRSENPDPLDKKDTPIFLEGSKRKDQAIQNLSSLESWELENLVIQVDSQACLMAHQGTIL